MTTWERLNRILDMFRRYIGRYFRVGIIISIQSEQQDIVKCAMAHPMLNFV